MNMHVVAIIPGGAEWAVVAVLVILLVIAPILVVIWFARKMMENKRENVRLRLEIGKLADELEQVRKQQRPE